MNIKQTLMTNWNFMRVFRLGLGVFLGIQAFKTHDAFSGVIAAFFIFQASTNTGCFGSQGCSTKPLENNTDKIEEVEFEEVKADKK